MKRIKAFYEITKPGILRGNLIACAAGFLYASKNDFDLKIFIATLIGTALVIASGCVYNNVLDRSIDLKMKRTKKRAIATGYISSRSALLYATLLGTCGLSILITYTNALTFYIGIVGLFTYVVVYGIAKRKTVYSTLVGTIPGATPPVAGYTAVVNVLDAPALLLFLILVSWQMAHFYSIALYRSDEYKMAQLPIISSKLSDAHIKIQILMFIFIFTVVCICVTLFGYAGISFLVVSIAIGAYWIYGGFRGLFSLDANKWARKMFGISLLSLLGVLSLLAINNLVP